jgi:hypothetical protein
VSDPKLKRWYWVDYESGDMQLFAEYEDGSSEMLLDIPWTHVDCTNPSVETERLIAQAPRLLQVTQELAALVAAVSVAAKDVLSAEIVAGLQQQAARAVEIAHAAIYGEPETPEQKA